MRHSLGSEPDPPTSYSRQRKVPRYTFIAVAEIIEGSSQTFIFAKTRKISYKGCYVETMKTLPVGTSLNMVISRDQGSFATKGRVIYVHEGLGMGIIFLNPNSEQLQILDHWLAERRPRNTDVI
jgi:hypothetical protein